MRTALFAVFTVIIFSNVIRAQTMSQSFGNTGVIIQGWTPFSTIQLTGGNYFQKSNLVNNNDVVLPSYGVSGLAGNTYFSDDWVKGSVTTTDKQTYSDELLFMFDKVSRQLFFKYDDSSTVMEADMNNVSLFSLITDKQHIFIEGNLFGKDYSSQVFEVLVLNQNKFSLLKSILSVYEQAKSNSAAQAMTQTENTGKYNDNPVYYVFNNNFLKQTELKEKNFLKAVRPDELKARAYMKSHKGQFNEEYAIALLNYLNIQSN